MKTQSLFIVDDDPGEVALLTAQLERTGSFVTEGFSDARAALDRLLTDPPDGVVCDLLMPDLDGLELTRRLRESHPFLPVIIVTGKGSEADAERCFAAGATDFVSKPVDPATLITRIRKATDEVAARELLARTARQAFDPHGIVGSHPRIRALREFVERVAEVSGASVLLLGESGTGKNLVARAIHGAGDVANFRFVEVNCAALPSHLLEAELFGYEKGAFTGAGRTKKGLVEEADGGTLFLDEVGSMPLELQAKLLTFLESRSFRRLGSTEDRTVNLRIITATNTDLAREARESRFRVDLFYRLNVASHTLPPLREIASDIPALTRHFTERAAAYFRKPVPEVPQAALDRLAQHPWPGNARELRNVVERAMIFSPASVLRIGPGILEVGASVASDPPAAGDSGLASAPGGLPMPPSPTGGDVVTIPRGLTLAEVERRYFEATLEDVDGKVNEAAERLGLTRKVFWARRKRLGMV